MNKKIGIITIMMFVLVSSLVIAKLTLDKDEQTKWDNILADENKTEDQKTTELVKTEIKAQNEIEISNMINEVNSRLDHFSGQENKTAIKDIYDYVMAK